MTMLMACWVIHSKVVTGNHKVLKLLKLKKSRKKSKLLMSSAMLRFRKQEYYSMLVTNENC